ncbi:PP2C family protein-serine/threonine phosphatase [Marinobacter sp.]|uniref:PP2C family protein-serine/threonine phosphatase n=1 Tax=Marinobacter sp. TaxID=50741 RepID=UPI00384E4239
MSFRTASFTHRGGVRKHNEDALLDATEAGVWVVADGMGGYQAGDVASQLACDTVAGELRRAGNLISPADLERALCEANSRIRQYGRESLDNQTLGSTVVALFIEGDRYHLFWAGDSRCYVIRKREVEQISRDHSQVAEMVDRGILQASEAERHPLAHVITRALGVDDTVALDYRTGPVARGDTFLLCSDGVSKEFSHANLAGFLRDGEIEEAGQAIMHSALVNKCNDNISCIIVNVGGHCYSSPALDNTEDMTVPIRSQTV